MVLHGILALHGVAWYCLVLHGIAFTILHYLALSCTILLYLALSCTILLYLSLSRTVLHIRYTCRQQMSPVIAFDIAIVAQKVKVQLLYNSRHAKSEKVGADQ